MLYDRLVIPVPPDPARAETAEDSAFAKNQWARWTAQGWRPERLRELLPILDPVVERIEWDRTHHEAWAREFAEYQQASRAGAADLVGRIMAGWVTGQVLLKGLPAMVEGAVAVAPFTTLSELEDDLGITETTPLQGRMAASHGLPATLVNAIVGREFLVPADPDWNELDLLREAVALVTTKDYSLARRAFHSSLLAFVDGRETDYDSIKGAVQHMNDHLQELDALARKRARWKRVDRAYFFTQVLVDLAAAPVAPVTLAHAALVLGSRTASAKLNEPASAAYNGPVGALLYDAQGGLGLARDGNIAERGRMKQLAETVFRR